MVEKRKKITLHDIEGSIRRFNQNWEWYERKIREAFPDLGTIPTPGKDCAQILADLKFHSSNFPDDAALVLAERPMKSVREAGGQRVGEFKIVRRYTSERNSPVREDRIYNITATDEQSALEAVFAAEDKNAAGLCYRTTIHLDDISLEPGLDCTRSVSYIPTRPLIIMDPLNDIIFIVERYYRPELVRDDIRTWERCRYVIVAKSAMEALTQVVENETAAEYDRGFFTDIDPHGRYSVVQLKSIFAILGIKSVPVPTESEASEVIDAP